MICIQKKQHPDIYFRMLKTGLLIIFLIQYQIIQLLFFHQVELSVLDYEEQCTECNPGTERKVGRRCERCRRTRIQQQHKEYDRDDRTEPSEDDIQQIEVFPAAEEFRRNEAGHKKCNRYTCG